jgi:hypothetical protein
MPFFNFLHNRSLELAFVFFFEFTLLKTDKLPNYVLLFKSLGHIFTLDLLNLEKLLNTLLCVMNYDYIISSLIF